jgi:hypothetical protein
MQVIDDFNFGKDLVLIVRFTSERRRYTPIFNIWLGPVADRIIMLDAVSAAPVCLGYTSMLPGHIFMKHWQWLWYHSFHCGTR